MRSGLVLTIAAVGGLLWYKKMQVISTIRGLRNNNPTNIERNGIEWKGMAADQSADSRFVVFESPEYGIRATARILRSYAERGVVTLSGIVNTWAPPVENKTSSYVAHVAQMTDIGPNEPVSESDYPHLIAALIKHENGINPYSMELIRKGVALA